MPAFIVERNVCTEKGETPRKNGHASHALRAGRSARWKVSLRTSCIQFVHSSRNHRAAPYSPSTWKGSGMQWCSRRGKPQRTQGTRGGHDRANCTAGEGSEREAAANFAGSCIREGALSTEEGKETRGMTVLSDLRLVHALCIATCI